jgi:hypothetical protein
MPFTGAYRWGASTSLPSITSTSVVASTAVFGSQTRTIRVLCPVASCQVLVIDANISSTVVDATGMQLFPSAAPEYFVVGPGQRLAAHHQGVTTASVFVTEALS